MHVIPATWEADIGGSQFEASSSKKKKTVYETLSQRTRCTRHGAILSAIWEGIGRRIVV
jgi:hypothetical protein